MAAKADQPGLVRVQCQFERAQSFVQVLQKGLCLMLVLEADDVRRFQLHLVENGLSIANRNRIMTGVKFLFRVTLRRHDLAAEIYHLKEPQKLPLTMSPKEAERLLTMAHSLRDHVMLCLGYGCGLRAGEIVRLRAGDIDSAQMIIRIVQSKGRKDRHVMLLQELLLSLHSGGGCARHALTPTYPLENVGCSPGVNSASI